MAPVEANFRELRNSFHSLCKHAPNITENKYNLLNALYAVECGIAAIILRQKNYNSTKNIEKKNHDIREMLDLCTGAPKHNLPSRIAVLPLPDGSRKNHVPFSKLHTVLRYGVKLQDTEWKHCAIEVEKLITWIEYNLKRRYA